MMKTGKARKATGYPNLWGINFTAYAVNLSESGHAVLFVVNCTMSGHDDVARRADKIVARANKNFGANLRPLP